MTDQPITPDEELDDEELTDVAGGEATDSLIPLPPLPPFPPFPG